MTDDPLSLDKLHDIVVPEPVSWWPPAPGWWFVIALMVVWSTYALVVVIIRWRANAYRREGLRLLDEIQSSAVSATQRGGSVVQISSLLKRVAMAAYRRETVASLTGSQWLTFLGRTASMQDFISGPAQLLGSASSEMATDLDSAKFAGICDAARHWIVQHHRLSEVDGMRSDSGEDLSC